MKCMICETEFQTTKINRKTCSTECGKLWRSRNKRQVIDDTLKCTKCLQIKPISEFYKSKRSQYRYYCKQCDDALVLESQKERKRIFVEYKGGKCQRCGYDKYIGALDFHHTNPDEKEFLINRNLSLERMKVELDKCILLCSNCHREEHHIM